MTKKEFVEKIYSNSTEDFKSKAHAEKVLTVIFETIKEGLSNGGEISIPSFGKFEVAERAQRTGRNPQTGEEIIIPATKVAKFKPGKELKEAVK